VRGGYTIRVVEINGDPGLLGFDADGTLIAAQAFEISDGVVWAIRSIVNPEKLAHISSTILPSLPPA
jgi:RNA polymerase sigma-70 factor, ECF subfamily